MKELFKRILTARVYDVARHTPLEPAPKCSERVGNDVMLKREDLQPVFSFKLRGAYNRLAHLRPEEKGRPVICASAGNHGQGVAWSARELGLEATVVMPRTTPKIKVMAVESFGARVVLSGDNYSEASEYCLQLQEESGATYIHPFNDPWVIAGQGTIGKEILEDCPQVDMIFVPVGGGGLIAGVAAFIKELAPDVQVIGVEPDDSDAMTRSVDAGEIVEVANPGIFADGVAVKEVGDETFRLTRQLVDDFVTVSTDEICSAIKDIYEETRAIMEPAGALSMAGMNRYVQEKGIRGKKIVTINSGANMNFQRLQFVAERAMTGSGRERLYAIRLEEKPGTLAAFCQTALAGQAITEFNYRYRGDNEAWIFVGITSVNGTRDEKFQAALADGGYVYHDMTRNELAKLHIRHMVGGAGPIHREVLYRFRFPERRGALADFLGTLGARWNISLFHYRFYGGDSGRVLIGMEVPEHDQAGLQGFLDRLGFSYEEETGNEAYGLFL